MKSSGNILRSFFALLRIQPGRSVHGSNKVVSIRCTRHGLHQLGGKRSPKKRNNPCRKNFSVTLLFPPFNKLLQREPGNLNGKYVAGINTSRSCSTIWSTRYSAHTSGGIPLSRALAGIPAFATCSTVNPPPHESSGLHLWSRGRH